MIEYRYKTEPSAGKIVAKVPAEPGWHILVFALDEEGKRIETKQEDGQVLTSFAFAYVAAWGMPPPDISSGSLDFLAAMVGLGGHGSKPWLPLAEGNHNIIEDPIAIFPPGVTIQEALAQLKAKRDEREAKVAEMNKRNP